MQGPGLLLSNNTQKRPNYAQTACVEVDIECLVLLRQTLLVLIHLAECALTRRMSVCLLVGFFLSGQEFGGSTNTMTQRKQT